MAKNPSPKKHRHQRGYTIMIISDDSDQPSASFRAGPYAVQLIAFGAFFAALAVLCYVLWSSARLTSYYGLTRRQSDEITLLRTDREALGIENSDLSLKVEQLTRSIQQKVDRENSQEAIEREKHLPSRYPLTGQASMQNTLDFRDAETIQESMALAEARENGGASPEDPAGDPILYFSELTAGIDVIATASGTVTEVGSDAKYGNRVTIDHGNGYQTIYRCADIPVVQKGDEVLQGNLIYIVSGTSPFGYQVTRDSAYIDPETVVEKNG